MAQAFLFSTSPWLLPKPLLCGAATISWELDDGHLINDVFFKLHPSVLHGKVPLVLIPGETGRERQLLASSSSFLLACNSVKSHLHTQPTQAADLESLRSQSSRNLHSADKTGGSAKSQDQTTDAVTNRSPLQWIKCSGAVSSVSVMPSLSNRSCPFGGSFYHPIMFSVPHFHHPPPSFPRFCYLGFFVT